MHIVDEVQVVQPTSTVEHRAQAAAPTPINRGEGERENPFFSSALKEAKFASSVKPVGESVGMTVSNSKVGLNVPFGRKLGVGLKLEARLIGCAGEAVRSLVGENEGAFVGRNVGIKEEKGIGAFVGTEVGR